MTDSICSPRDPRTQPSGYMRIDMKDNHESWLIVVLPDGKTAAFNLGTRLNQPGFFEQLLETAAGLGEARWSDWCSIETAPKDGAEILASDFYSIEIISFVLSESGWSKVRLTREGEQFYPAVWVPLPGHPPLPGEG